MDAALRRGRAQANLLPGKFEESRRFIRRRTAGFVVRYERELKDAHRREFCEADKKNLGVLPEVFNP